MRLTPFGDLQGGSYVQKIVKLGFIWLTAMQPYRVEKIRDFMYFQMTNSNIFQNFIMTEKTEKFLPIFVWEIFKNDFQIPGKILSGILVQHMFWCLKKGLERGGQLHVRTL